MAPEPSHFASAAPPGPPVGRLAPTPSGALHLGHARSFLLAWWSARAAGGRVVLRLEDLDRARCRPEHAEAALGDMEWLGLDWDGAPLVQSADPEPYRAALERLARAGRLYACTCTRAQRRASAAAAGSAAEAPHASAPHRGEFEPRYPGTCRARRLTRLADWPPESGLRLALPPGAHELQDALAGAVRGDVEAELGDLLLVRRDGVVGYQLAVAVDDARQAVTEVLRGDDLLPSALRQAHLQRALDLAHPRWIHVPLVVDEGGERLAKRRADLALGQLRALGVDPRALVSWVAESAGMGPRDAHLDAQGWLGAFDLARLPRIPAVFAAPDVEALRARAPGPLP